MWTWNMLAWATVLDLDAENHKDPRNPLLMPWVERVKSDHVQSNLWDGGAIPEQRTHTASRRYIETNSIMRGNSSPDHGGGVQNCFDASVKTRMG